MSTTFETLMPMHDSYRYDLKKRWPGFLQAIIGWGKDGGKVLVATGLTNEIQLNISYKNLGLSKNSEISYRSGCGQNH